MSARTGLQAVWAYQGAPRHDREATPWGRRLAAQDDQRRRELASVGRQNAPTRGAMTRAEARAKDAWGHMARKRKAGK